MSEYQYIAFRAIDAAVSGKNLKIMRSQSSRANITPYSYTNEYTFGDFGGDACEMLRRGYDFHLHYANFGVRTLMIRLPNGFPNQDVAERYFIDDALHFVRDKKTSGGVLIFEPFYEPDQLPEVYDAEDLLEHLLPIRAEMLQGDLRPLYLAHLAVACDCNHDPEETTEAPVPPGLAELTSAQKALARFCGIDDSMLKAAAQDSPRLLEPADVRNLRTIAELQGIANAISEKREKQKRAQRERRRAGRLEQMAADPAAVLEEANGLVALRSTAAYGKVAELLADLREALSDSEDAGIAQQCARQLAVQYPKLHRLKKSLQARGLLDAE